MLMENTIFLDKKIDFNSNNGQFTDITECSRRCFHIDMLSKLLTFPVVTFETDQSLYTV